MKGKSLLLLLIPVLSLAESSATVRRSLKLNLRRAVELATSSEANAHIQTAGENVRQAESRSTQARATLLPGFDARLGQQNFTRNLAALGIPSYIGGQQIPRLVGPLNVFGARLTATQTILDVSAIRRFQASRIGVRTAESEQRNVREQVTVRVAKAYLTALRADAELDAIKANAVLAKALLGQAENQNAAGTGTGIEIVRAKVQLANECQ